MEDCANVHTRAHVSLGWCPGSKLIYSVVRETGMKTTYCKASEFVSAHSHRDTYDCDKISHLFAINSFHVRTIKVSIAI